MKRHPAFIPLSREHHDGLLLATRLQQGTKALERLWSHDLQWQSGFVVEFFETNLSGHFRIEEEFLFPTVAGLMPKDNGMIGDLIREHREMEALVETLRHPTGKPPEATLKRIGEILERHIRREERELFPFCEAHMSASTLASLGRKMEE